MPFIIITKLHGGSPSLATTRTHGYAVIEDRKLLEAIKAEGGRGRVEKQVIAYYQLVSSPFHLPPSTLNVG
jgi:hypothetical protein